MTEKRKSKREEKEDPVNPKQMETEKNQDPGAQEEEAGGDMGLVLKDAKEEGKSVRVATETEMRSDVIIRQVEKRKAGHLPMKYKEDGKSRRLAQRLKTEAKMMNMITTFQNSCVQNGTNHKIMAHMVHT